MQPSLVLTMTWCCNFIDYNGLRLALSIFFLYLYTHLPSFPTKLPFLWMPLLSAEYVILIWEAREHVDLLTFYDDTQLGCAVLSLQVPRSMLMVFWLP